MAGLRGRWLRCQPTRGTETSLE